ncbi:MAG: squalene synthase HpnC [Phycisphaerales bacterium]|nr:squalene synthase HpnC [Phycisphaerales bacterium]
MSVIRGERTVDLASFGPTSGRIASDAEARAWCARLTAANGENFSVLSRFVPPHLVDDFTAVYAFCRVSDDLGDEMECVERATELLAWWRSELARCYRGEASHPVFVALRSTIARHQLPAQLFHDLISAFESDQTKIRYATWEELLEYCRLSANPVGRLILMVLGEGSNPEALAASDSICTALQLTNHWQDARRDLMERNRIYIPMDAWPHERFEERLAATCKQGFAPDQQFMAQWREVLRLQTVRTWALFESGEKLLPLLQPAHRPLIWLFLAGGTGTLRLVETWNFETCLVRPRLSRLAKLMLVGRARWNLRKLRAGSLPASPSSP